MEVKKKRNRVKHKLTAHDKKQLVREVDSWMWVQKTRKKNRVIHKPTAHDKKQLVREVDSWKWVEKRWKRNRVKNKETEHDKNAAWGGKMTNESGGEEKYSQTQTERAY